VTYLCQPLAVPRIWGSRRSPSGEAIGETWWLYDGGGYSTPLLDASTGRPAGTVSSVLESGGLPGLVCPLTVKTLHTAEPLSLQVHPGAFGGGLCKAETWIFLEVSGGSRVLAGLSPGVTRSMLEEAVRSGKLDGALDSWEVHPGDSMHLPPGTAHALGPGFEVLEIQSGCDVTYRLSDWGRIGPDGHPRRLDIDEGLRCIDPEGGRPMVARDGLPGGLERLAGYSIRAVADSVFDLPAGGVLFLAGGRAEACGRSFAPPCCIMASAAGCTVRVSGLAYAATAVEERWTAEPGA